MNAKKDWKLRVFYDGACPLCSREMSWLMRRVADGAVLFDDISAPEFNSERLELDKQTLMKEIHAILPNGSIICGMEVFRELYALAGLGWIMRPTAWPVFRPFFDALYRMFARNRLLLKGSSA